MRFPHPLIKGVLLRRYQRFLADVRLPDGRLLTAHCPNSGSMKGCNLPGREVRLSPATGSRRRTRYTWELIHLPTTWVGINTLTANRLVAESLLEGSIPELGGFLGLTREVSLGENSRIAFLLHRHDGLLFLEVKNITLAEDGRALFPDAPTLRGRKHLRSLMAARRQGRQAAIFYVIQREDARRFATASGIDPEYAEILRQAHREGVRIFAYRARVSPEEIKLAAPVPVELGI